MMSKKRNWWKKYGNFKSKDPDTCFVYDDITTDYIKIIENEYPVSNLSEGLNYDSCSLIDLALLLLKWSPNGTNGYDISWKHLI